MHLSSRCTHLSSGHSHRYAFSSMCWITVSDFMILPAQSVFEERSMVLGVYPSIWIVEHYFSETLGISYEAIKHTMRVHWQSTGTFSTRELDRRIILVCDF